MFLRYVLDIRCITTIGANAMNYFKPSISNSCPLYDIEPLYIPVPKPTGPVYAFALNFSNEEVGKCRLRLVTVKGWITSITNKEKRKILEEFSAFM
jgi:hypothetical protein